jgi:hypothetical protein
MWVVSSAVEHYLDMVGVTGSIPVPPTICFSDNVKIALLRGTVRIFEGVCAFVLANVVLLMMADFADVDSVGKEMGQSAYTENLSADLFVVSKGPRA